MMFLANIKIKPKSLILCSLVLMMVSNAVAQTALLQPSTEFKNVTITRTDTPPVVDGILDDAVWSRASTVDALHQVEPVEYAKPSVRTVIYLAYTDDTLYVAAHLYGDPDMVTATVLRQGGSLRSEDVFAIILSPFNDGRSGYRFETNPNGVREDALYVNVSDEQRDWHAIWYAKSSITDDGWVTEMAIPFKSISFDPDSDTWGMDFVREIPARNETIAWVSRNRHMNPSTVGQVSGFEGMEQGLGLDIIVSGTAMHRHDFLAGHSATQYSPSVDMFYKITPSMTGALTVNTDFSAVEVDDRKINLGRFALFFPEKRNFFLQGSDIFEFGRLDKNGRPFFSRRIGLSKNGKPVDIDAGAKVTGRLGRWNIGILSVRQEATAQTEADTSTVARVSANVLDESRVGFIVTNGSPQSNLDNSVVGLDFLYRNSHLAGGHLLQAQAWVQKSNTEGVHGDDLAFGVGFKVPNQTGFRGGLSYRQLGLNFNPALGFVNRRGVYRINGNVHYTYRPTDSYLREISGGIEVQRTDLLTGGLQSQELELELFDLDSQLHDSLSLKHTFKKEVLRRPFEVHSGVVIPVGTYTFEETRLSLRTARFRALSGRAHIQIGEFYDGERTELSGGFDWSPSKHFTTGVNYTVNYIDLPQGSFVTRLTSLSADIAFTPKLSWTNRVQYDNVSAIIGIQSRLQWILQPGRKAYLVLNHNLEDFDQDRRFHSALSEVAVKFNYTFRF